MSNACLLIFFFNDTATTEIYTLSLHDALPISVPVAGVSPGFCSGLLVDHLDSARLMREAARDVRLLADRRAEAEEVDWKSTRLKFSHPHNSYVAFFLKKKKNQDNFILKEPHVY